MSDRPLPLAGIRVIEFCHIIMGPTCGLILGDLGADVIKIEPAPDGDNSRRLVGSGAGFFTNFNRNKRAIALDLKTEEGMAIAKDLIKTADVLTENFRPGAMEKLGLGPDHVKALNPRLIYASHKGFLSGPYEDRSALDEVVQMMTVLAYMTGPKGRPLRAGASVNDMMGGMFATIAVLAALRERDRTGQGQAITSALYENCVFLCGQHIMQYLVLGEPAPPMPERLAAWGVYDVFDCSDGQLFLGVVTDTQWRIFCEAFGFHDLAVDPDLSTNPKRCKARDKFMPRLRELFLTMRRDDLLEKVAGAGLPYAPIAMPHELLQDEHLLASGGLLPVTLPDGSPGKSPALPIEMDGRRFGVRHDVPRIGEQGDEILTELGFAPDRIASLRSRGIVAGGRDAPRRG